MIGHEFWPGGAVHAKRQRLGEAQRRPHGFNGLPRKHGAHWLDGHRNHEGYLLANLSGKFLNRQQSRFDVASILAGFNQQQVDATFHQSLCLNIVSLAQLLERDATRDGNRFRRGANGAGHKARLAGRA